MRWIRVAAVVAAFAAVIGMAKDTLAGKPGGTSPPPATGTIYFQDLSTLDATNNTYTYGSMDGSGGSRAVLLRTSHDARPSRRLHGGTRWFLASVRLDLVGLSRNDLIAVREDGAREVRLTNNDGTMAYSNLDWAPDEDGASATVSMVARRWTGPTRDDTVVPGTAGLYTAHLTFDGTGDVVGLDADPAYRLSLGIVGDSLGERADARGYSWSPDMARLVVQSYYGGWDGDPSTPDPQIRVVDATSGAVTPLGAGDVPDWSPDGSKIAYRRWIDGKFPGFALQTVRPDGSGVATLLFFKQRVGATRSQYLYSPKWSPDGAYLAYEYVDAQNGYSWTHYIYRIAADGTGKTNLTPEVTTGSGGGVFGLALVDWR